MLLKSLLGSIVAITFSSFLQAQVVALDDAQLSDIRGQALLSLAQSTGTSPVDSSPLGFFKLGAEAVVEINANIKSLQLGCGGVNGANGCDVDISNLGLSGLNDGVDANGNPTFSNGRSSTDAAITNPFIEFAIKNPNNLATREMVGFRLGAEKILGLLTLGTNNVASPTDGIKSFSGYLNIAQTTGNVLTKQTTFSDIAAQGLKPPATLIATILGTDYSRQFTSDTTNAANTGLTLPSVPASFILPQTTVKGTRQTQVVINNIPARVSVVPLAAGSGVAGVNDAVFANDQLYVTFDPICILIICVSNAKFKPADGSVLKNLDINVSSITQNLNAVHNIPLSGSGGYLSFQKEAVKWNGSNSDDTAQRGWWLSVKDPVQLGVLNSVDQVNIDSLLPQIAGIVSNYLGQPGNEVRTGGSSINAAFGGVTTALLNIDFAGETYTKPSFALGSQVFQSQTPPSNCYGNLKFC